MDRASLLVTEGGAVWRVHARRHWVQCPLKMLRNRVASLAAVCVLAGLPSPGWAVPPEAPICGPVWCTYWLHSEEPVPDGVDEFGGEVDLALDLSELGGEADLLGAALGEPASDPDLGLDDPAQEPGEGVSLSPMPLTTGSVSHFVVFVPEQVDSFVAGASSSTRER